MVGPVRQRRRRRRSPSSTHPAAPVSWGVVHQKDITRGDPIDSAVFIDSLERVLQTKEDAELDLGSGTSTRTGMRVSGRIDFDARGRVAAVGQPVFDSGPASQFVDVPSKNPTAVSYDALDRVREVRFPHGAVTRIDYGFGTLDGAPRLLTTRTDPNGRATRFYHDVRENIRGVEQTNTIAGVSRTLITRYAFDALSQLLAVTDALGNATRLEWDTLGRNVVARQSRRSAAPSIATTRRGTWGRRSPPTSPPSASRSATPTPSAASTASTIRQPATWSTPMALPGRRPTAPTGSSR